MSKPFKGVNWGKKQIKLYDAFEMLPVEIHLKEDGAIGDRPSFCIVMSSRHPDGINPDVTLPCVFGQISLDMLNDGLKDIGYKVVPVNNNSGYLGQNKERK